MRVPQVSDRVKELPAQALRGVFAGIGELLLITDRLRNKTPAGQQVPRARGPERPEPAVETAKAKPAVETAKAKPAVETAKAKPAEKAPEVRDPDKTGNVRLLDGAKAGVSGAAAAAEAPVAAEVPVADEAAGEPGPPLPNYDELSVASLRARLRNLDAAQVKQMAEYERAHAARADVIAMFERRIGKLEAGG